MLLRKLAMVIVVMAFRFLCDLPHHRAGDRSGSLQIHVLLSVYPTSVNVLLYQC